MDANSMAILVLLGSFFLMVFLRFPIAYAVALSSVFCLLFQGHNLTTICQQMVKGISSFSLMACLLYTSFAALIPRKSKTPYTLVVTYDNGVTEELHDPYSFAPQYREEDLKKFAAGIHYKMCIRDRCGAGEGKASGRI